MEVLFVHDHRFIPIDGEVYSDGQFPDWMWDRYLSVFDEMTVIGRKQSEKDREISQLALSSHPRVHFRFTPNLSTVKAWLGRRWRVAEMIEDVLREHDALIARLPSELGYLATRVAKRLGKPWAVEVVDCAWDGLWNYGTLTAKLYAPVRYWLTRRAVWEAPFALYVTEDFLQRRYPNRDGETTACSNVEINEPQSHVLENRLERIQTERQGPLVFGLIGSLDNRTKGIQTVLAALPVVREKIPSVIFRVLGPGDPTPWIEEAEDRGVRDLVRFDGQRPPGYPVMDWLDEVDVYLHPSLKEGLPRALIEAMSRGCPAIGSNCAGIPELLEQDCLIEPKDHRALAQLMLRAARDRAWQREQAQRNWKVAKQYSSTVLDKRRNRFWTSFAKAVDSGSARR